MSENIDERLAAIRARAEAATPGPWHIEDDSNFKNEEHAGSVVTEQGYYLAKIEPDVDDADGNAEFIAHAREDVPYLLDLVTALSSPLPRPFTPGAV